VQIRLASIEDAMPLEGEVLRKQSGSALEHFQAKRTPAFVKKMR